MIEVKGLTKTFEKEPVVHDLTFSILENKCVALLGPNGAGKTTTLRMMAGLLTPTGGTISIPTGSSNDIRHSIGYLPQHPAFHSWMTAKEFLIYVGRLAHLSKAEARERTDGLLERVGIKDAANRRIGKFSGGMKQRLGIAQAMIHKPKVLMLDEPVSALDPIGRREVLTLMEELKKETSVLYSTHILSDAEEMSDEILLMHKGKLVESGALEEVKSRYQTDRLSIRIDGDLHTYKEKLKAISSITEIDVRKQTLWLSVSSIEQAREDIWKLALKEDWPVTHFEIGQTTLEDLFMKVVNAHAVVDNIS